MLEERLGRNIEKLGGVVGKATAEVREEQAQGMRRLVKVEGGRGVQVSSKDRKTVEEASWRPQSRNRERSRSAEESENSPQVQDP